MNIDAYFECRPNFSLWCIETRRDYVDTEQTEVVWVTVRSNIARFLVSVSLCSLYLNRWVWAYLDSRFGPSAVQCRSVYIVQYDARLFADFKTFSFVAPFAGCGVLYGP
jgi:hypothetical protein